MRRVQKRVLPSKSDLRATPVECTPRLCACVCVCVKIPLSSFSNEPNVVNTAWSILLTINIRLPSRFLFSFLESLVEIIIAQTK